MLTHEQRVSGIQEVIRMAIRLDQPVFCGQVAFECCEQIFGKGIEEEFYTVIKLSDKSNAILCTELQDMNFFTCPMMQMGYNPKLNNLRLRTLH